MTQFDDCSSDDSYSTVSSRVTSTTNNDANTESSKIYRVACMGDINSGKSQLLFTYCGGYPANWIAEIFDNYHKKVIINNSKNVHLELSESNTIEELESIKCNNSLNHIDCFLLCYSITNRKSYNNCFSIWYQELKKYNSKIPIILIATKIDLRNNINNRNENYYCNNENENNENLISYDEGLEMSKKIGAAYFFEISSLLNKNNSIEDLFSKLALVSYNFSKNKNKKKKKGCNLM